jgi:O-antigen/teichoic acid export membrane protein
VDPLISPLDPLPSVMAAADQKKLDGILVRGVAWTAAVKWLTQAFTWGTTIVVARLLLPSDYGLVGIAAIYVNLFTLFSEFGIGTAVVTLQDLSDNQVSQLNTLSLSLGVFGSIVSSLIAMPLGKFFHAPKLPLIVIVLSLGFTISGMRTVPYSLLQKELRFKLLAVFEGIQGVVQASITLLLAFLGFGYWALVLGILSFSVTPTVLVLFWRRQSFVFPRFSSIRSAMHYSRHILIGRLSWAAYNDSDFIVAGRFLGIAPLGAYTLAFTLAHAPLDKLTTLVNRVTPSVFAKIQKDSEALRRYLCNITGGMSLIVFPAVIGMALIAPEFVLGLLGSKWTVAVIPLQILALCAIFHSNNILLSPLLNAIGEERLSMWNSVVTMGVLPVSFYLASRWGAPGIAAVWVTIYPLTQIPLFLRTFKRIALPRPAYLATMWPAISGCAAMAICIATFRFLSPSSYSLYLRLELEIIIGILSYGAVVLLLHREYVRGMLKFARGAG